MRSGDGQREQAEGQALYAEALYAEAVEDDSRPAVPASLAESDLVWDA
jgi:hypothetical protein